TGHRRIRPPGAHRVYACPRRHSHDLVLEAQHEPVDDGGFGRRVVGVAGLAVEGGRGADEDEAAMAAGRQPAQVLARGEEGSGQVVGGEPMYEEGRKLYTGEINAAVRGAKAAGATEIVVMDCHGAGKGWNFNSLLPEELDPACEFVVQDEWTAYTAFLEEGCDAALFVGMHARAGSATGVLNHTVSGQQWQNLW